MFEAEKIVREIEGLNSLSTFHRWYKLVEKLCNVKFQQRTIQVGKTIYTKVYEFSELNVEKFQKVAELCNRGQPIREAIEEVFEKQVEKDEKDIENKILLEKLIKCVSPINKKADILTGKVADMNQQMNLVKRDNYQLKERIIQLENGKLDKPFSRKKS